MENLAAAAFDVAKPAAPYADVFISAGLPQDFIAQLTAASDLAGSRCGDLRPDGYSDRSAVAGSTDDARSAGRRHPAIAVATQRTIAAANVTGSPG